MAGCIGERAKPKRRKLGPGPGENGSYAVEGIIDSKLFPASLHSRVPRVTKYRVRFVGWGPMHDEWMLEDDLEDAQELLTDYKHREEVRVLQNETLGLYSQLGAISEKLEDVMEQNKAMRIKLRKQNGGRMEAWNPAVVAAAAPAVAVADAYQGWVYQGGYDSDGYVSDGSQFGYSSNRCDMCHDGTCPHCCDDCHGA